MKIAGFELEPEGPFKPAKRRIHYAFQESLFEKGGKRHAHVEMGLFYELFTLALVGGKLTNTRLVKVKSDQGKKDFELKPDVTKGNLFYEAKACRMGYHLLLDNSQMKNYNTLQTFHPNSVITFIIFRHSLRKIKSYPGNTEELFHELCERTRYVLMLPYSIIYALADTENENTRHYDGTGGWYCTSVPSTVLNEFAFDPLSALSRNGLPTIGRFKSKVQLLPSIEIGRMKTKPMPIAILDDTDYIQWQEKVADETIPF